MRYLILGLGVEGRAAVKFLLTRRDKDIIAIDRAAPSTAFIDALPAKERFAFISEGDALEGIQNTDVLLRSPGISPAHEICQRAAVLGCTITTPTGYWLGSVAPLNTITITGTKGKSTSAALTAALLTALGEKSQVFGNIGAPALENQLPFGLTPVVELSSYMMHDLPERIGLHVITNLYKEHTTWHGTESAYQQAKLRPFRQDVPATGLAPRALIEQFALPGCVKAIEDQVHLKGGRLSFGALSVCPADLNPRFGSVGNILALRLAVAIARLRHSDAAIHAAVLDMLPAYQGLPHRQQIIPSTDGRIWVDDALATVPEALLLALEQWQGKPVTLLLGGADRGQDFSLLKNAFTDDHTIIAFGSTTKNLSMMLTQSGCKFHLADSFEHSLVMAAKLTPTGGVVLFSPAAASEPPHTNYKHRAEIFMKFAKNA